MEVGSIVGDIQVPGSKFRSIYFAHCASTLRQHGAEARRAMAILHASINSCSAVDNSSQQCKRQYASTIYICSAADSSSRQCKRHDACTRLYICNADYSARVQTCIADEWASHGDCQTAASISQMDWAYHRCGKRKRNSAAEHATRVVRGGSCQGLHAGPTHAQRSASRAFSTCRVGR